MNSKIPTPEQQAKFRYMLLQSAYRAKMSGYNRFEWKSSNEVKNFIKINSLRDDLAEHISAWVWTFKR